LLVFGKAQVSAFLGSIVDYLLMISITEIFGLHYTISIAIGGIAGAYVNFLLNRRWTFRSKDITYHNSFLNQISKFLIVVITSILIKSSGTFYITSYFNIDYKISRILTDLLVSLLLNYNLQKRWVFKKVNS
jgi:putative flippase GtrA